MNISEEFLAAVLQDSDTRKKAIRAGIRPYHLDNGYAKQVYEVVSDLSVRGVEVTRETIVNEFIHSGRAAKEKSVYASYVSNLYDRDVEYSNYSFEQLKKKRVTIDYANAIQKQAQVFMETQDHVAAQNAFESSFREPSDTLVFKDYFDQNNIEQRDKERVEIASPDAGSIMMHGRFEFMDKYFPLGIQKGTITTIGGPTGVGKTLMMTNLIDIAISPPNSLNALYLIGENREIESTSRLDAVVTEVAYTHLYNGQGNDTYLKIMSNNIQGYGNLYTCKFHINSITVQDIDSAIEAFYETSDVRFDAVFVDSPEHVRSTRNYERKHLNLAATYEDFKASCERLEYALVSTLQLKASAAGKETASSEDAAGAYAISQLADNQIFFLKNKEDFLLNRRRIVFPKLRDSKNDGGMAKLRVTDSLRFYSESEDEEFKIPSLGEDPEDSFESQHEEYVKKLEMQPVSPVFYSLNSRKERNE